MTTQQHTEHNLVELCANGYWFCFRCERIVAIADGESPAHCPRCKHRTAEWQHPIDFKAGN